MLISQRLIIRLSRGYSPQNVAQAAVTLRATLALADCAFCCHFAENSSLVSGVVVEWLATFFICVFMDFASKALTNFGTSKKTLHKNFRFAYTFLHYRIYSIVALVVKPCIELYFLMASIHKWGYFMEKCLQFKRYIADYLCVHLGQKKVKQTVSSTETVCYTGETNCFKTWNSFT